MSERRSRVPALSWITVGERGYAAASWRGVRTSIFLLRIILPLSFLVSLMDWLGILRHIGEIFSPAMVIWKIPGEAALVLVSGWLVGIYGAIAAMAVLPLSPEQVTILAVLTLTAHNLPVETTVQHRTGTPWWLMLAVRLGTAALLGWLVALAVGGGAAPPAPLSMQPGGAARPPAGEAFLAWARSAGTLSLKVVVILFVLMILTEWMRARQMERRLSTAMRPILRLLGLSGSVSFLWITANVLGLAYGSGLLMEMAREPGRYHPSELRDLNVSIGVCHSLLEDTALFLAIGASLFWITIPRLAAAALVVRLVRLARAPALSPRASAG